MIIRKKQEKQLQKRSLWGVGLILAVFFLFWILFAPGRGFLQYRKLQRDRASLAQENRQLQKKNIELSEEIKRLQTDDAYLEQVARKKYGLLRKNEAVYEFDTPQKRK